MKRVNILAMVICFALGSEEVLADISTIAPEGINSQGLLSFDGVTPLTGSGVSIGQVEDLRPGKKDVDGVNNYSNFVNIAGVFLIGDAANPDHDISPHAEWVASVMASTDTLSTGVATGASLYASAYQTTDNDPTSDATMLLTMQKIASLPGMRAVNNSWGQLLRSGVAIDGNSQLTLGFDWIASRYDVLEGKSWK